MRQLGWRRCRDFFAKRIVLHSNMRSSEPRGSVCFVSSGDLIESLTVKRPWMIILEDLHWSDFATVDALSRIARRDRKSAILVLATYRPADVAAGGHPIRTVHQDLQIHGRCTEVALDRLTRAEVEHYLDLRFDSADLAEALAERVFARTGGQPLFVVSLVDHLVAQGDDRRNRWTVATAARGRDFARQHAARFAGDDHAANRSPYR